MLVLSRKEKQVIRIGDDIEIIVTQIKGNTVRLGISAPQKVTILRGELTVFHQNPEAIQPPMDFPSEFPYT